MNDGPRSSGQSRPKPNDMKHDFSHMTAEDMGAIIDKAHAQIGTLKDKAQAWRDVKTLMSSQNPKLRGFIEKLQDDWHSRAGEQHRAATGRTVPQMDDILNVCGLNAQGIDRTVEQITVAKEEIDKVRKGKAEALSLFESNPEKFDNYHPNDPHGRPTEQVISAIHDNQARFYMERADTEVRQAWLDNMHEPRPYAGLSSDDVREPRDPLYGDGDSSQRGNAAGLAGAADSHGGNGVIGSTSPSHDGGSAPRLQTPGAPPTAPPPAPSHGPSIGTPPPTGSPPPLPIPGGGSAPAGPRSATPPASRPSTMRPSTGGTGARPTPSMRSSALSGRAGASAVRPAPGAMGRGGTTRPVVPATRAAAGSTRPGAGSANNVRAGQPSGGKGMNRGTGPASRPGGTIRGAGGAGRGKRSKDQTEPQTSNRPDTNELADLLEQNRPKTVPAVIGRDTANHYATPTADATHRPPGLKFGWRPPPGASADFAERNPKPDPRGLTRFKDGVYTTRAGLMHHDLPETMRRHIVAQVNTEIAEQERSWTRQPPTPSTELPPGGVIRGARKPADETEASPKPVAPRRRRYEATDEHDDTQHTAPGGLLDGIDMTGGRGVITGAKQARSGVDRPRRRRLCAASVPARAPGSSGP